MFVRLVAASFGGACIAFSFPPTAYWAAAFVGVALLLRAADGARAWASFLIGWTGGCAGHLVACAWLWQAIAGFTGMSPAAVAACVAAVVVYHGLQFGVFSLLAANRRRHGLVSHCAETAAIWVVVEWSFPKILPWTLGDGLGGALLLRQAADLAGPHGLSWATAAAAAALVTSVSATSDPLKRWRATAAAIGVVCLLAIYGGLRLIQLNVTAPAESLHVTLVQGGLGLHADAQQQNDLAWKIYEPLTVAATARQREAPSAIGQLLVWPEATLRAYLSSDEDQRRRLQQLTALLGQPLMVGALDLPPSGGGELNAAFLFVPAGASKVQAYHKRRLVPFAEYVPGVDRIGFLRAWRPIGHFAPGRSAAPLRVQEGVPLAAAICFEALHAGGFNSMVRAGARLLVSLSDDAWFARTSEVQQALGVSAMRAVETRRWLARASDSGVSAFIDPAGRVVAKLDEGVMGAIQADLPLRNGLSLYVRCGDWIVGASLVLLAWFFVKRERKTFGCLTLHESSKRHGADDLRIE